jgi:hypothetical protein
MWLPKAGVFGVKIPGIADGDQCRLNRYAITIVMPTKGHMAVTADAWTQVVTQEGSHGRPPGASRPPRAGLAGQNDGRRKWWGPQWELSLPPQQHGCAVRVYVLLRLLLCALAMAYWLPCEREAIGGSRSAGGADGVSVSSRLGTK